MKIIDLLYEPKVLADEPLIFDDEMQNHIEGFSKKGG
jgi:hypothetical protein